jgi:hypothetical protein
MKGQRYGLKKIEATVSSKRRRDGITRRGRRWRRQEIVLETPERLKRAHRRSKRSMTHTGGKA